MSSWWNGLRLQTRFMIFTGCGVLGLAACLVLAVDWYETSQLDQKLHRFSENELSSLNALVDSVMEQRRRDHANISMDVFNAWFESRNANYPGRLWSAWSPDMVAYMAKEEPTTAAKRPQDPIDEEALRTGKAVGRFVGDTYRFSQPIVLGVTPGSERRTCANCHVNLMGAKTGDVIAVFSSSLDTAGDFAKLQRTLAITGLAGLLAVAAMMVAIRLIFSRVIARPLDGMTGVMGQLAGGDVEVEIPGVERQDETGAMARAVLVFRTNLVRQRELEAAQRADFEARQRRSARIEELTVGFDRDASRIVDGVAAAAGQLHGAATSMGQAAANTTDKAAGVSAASEQASANVQAVASAAEELSASIGEIGRQVTHSSTIARHAMDEASRTEGEVSELSASVTRIGDVVVLINDIAAQTNLLALNATIEAARAGEAGKGFAVVAHEVKNLANQTAKATGEIGDQIAAVQAQTQRVVDAIKAIHKTIFEVGEIAASIASSVEQQTAATGEIARNVEQAAAGTAEVSGNVVGVQQAADQTDAAAAELLEASTSLADQSQRLKAIITDFLAEVGQA
jgi:methyl-accepting chemotaxis protein